MYAAILTTEDLSSPCEFYPAGSVPEDPDMFPWQATDDGCLYCEGTSVVTESFDGTPNTEGVVVMYLSGPGGQEGAYDAVAHARCVWDAVLYGDPSVTFTLVPTMANAFRGSRLSHPRHSR